MYQLAGFMCTKPKATSGPNPLMHFVGWTDVDIPASAVEQIDDDRLAEYGIMEVPDGNYVVRYFLADEILFLQEELPRGVMTLTQSLN